MCSFFLWVGVSVLRRVRGLVYVRRVCVCVEGALLFCPSMYVVCLGVGGEGVLYVLCSCRLYLSLYWCGLLHWRRPV